jgi:hypothetical protein
MDQAAPQAADEQTLAALRWDWGEAYRIGWDAVRGYWARRRDGLGGDITSEDPGSLLAAIRADYSLKPVPRDLGRPAAPDPAGDLNDASGLPPGRVLRDGDEGTPCSSRPC